MKIYRVVFDPGAQEEALEAAEHIAKFAPTSAAKWFAGLEKLIESLHTMPGRCGKARESETLGTDLRQYIHHSHRVIFLIEEEAGIVRILHIRHSARRAIGESQEQEEGQ